MPPSVEELKEDRRSSFRGGRGDGGAGPCLDRLVLDDDEEEESKCGSSARLVSLDFAVGAHVERKLDGQWFLCVVRDGYVEDDIAFYDVEYTDDGNKEVDIPADDLRALDEHTAPRQSPRTPKFDDYKPEFSLASLIDTTAEPDNPTVKIHGSHATDDVETTFIVNGASTRIGNGGGLRGIRFLRESVNMR